MESATLYLEGQCNLRCTHCFVGHDHLNPRPSLDTDEVRRTLQNLREGGVKSITLLGGEVTIYRTDLEEILAECDELGFTVSINTNLTALKPIEQAIKHPSVQNITVSLDGATKETHDCIRGKGTFDRTYKFLKILAPRQHENGFELNITFALGGGNSHETSMVVDLANELSVTKLNVQEIRLSGNAADNSEDHSLPLRQRLYSVVGLLIYWIQNGETKLDYHVTPALAAYMDERFGVGLKLANFQACGGTDVYGYVDLRGNHLPCPAMSFEESENKLLDHRKINLDITSKPASEIWNSSAFRGFNHSINTKHRMRRMDPCKDCTFFDQCSPCTAEVVQGREGTVDICKAIQMFGHEYAPKSAQLFSQPQ